MSVSDVAKKLKRIRTITAVLSVFGIVLSCYAYHVETRKEHDRSYQAMCDISSHMSCSKVFTSKYGRGFGLLGHIIGFDSNYNQPNSVFGVIFYSSIIIFGFLEGPTFAKINIGLGVLSNIGSLYLAYILYFVLNDFCVVCVTTYVINAFLLACGIWRLKIESQVPIKKLH